MVQWSGGVSMRKILFPSLFLGMLLGAAAVAMTSSNSRRPAADLPVSGSLDARRPDDRQMMAFDRSHPQCQLWTNWQKMCSRTGPGGATYCAIDAEMRVNPSRPFCVDTAATELSSAEV